MCSSWWSVVGGVVGGRWFVISGRWSPFAVQRTEDIVHLGITYRHREPLLRARGDVVDRESDHDSYIALVGAVEHVPMWSCVWS